MPTNQTVSENQVIPPSVDFLKGRISSGGGLLKPYNYKIYCSGWTPEENREMNDILQETSLPSKTHATQPVYYGGPLRQIPYITSYPGTLNLTFLCTENSAVRSRLYQWMDSVISPSSGITNFRKGPKGFIREQMTIEVHRSAQFDTIPVVVGGVAPVVPFFVPIEGLKYTLYDVFPDSINEVSLSQSSQNEVLRMTVTMMYRKWIKGSNIDDILEQE